MKFSDHVDSLMSDLQILSSFPLMGKKTIIFFCIFCSILFSICWRKKWESKKIQSIQSKRTQSIHIEDSSKYIGKRVKLTGWIQHIRKTKKIWFIELRDGSGIPPLLSCILYGDLCKSKKSSLLTVESSVIIYGKIKKRKVTKKRTVTKKSAKHQFQKHSKTKTKSHKKTMKEDKGGGDLFKLQKYFDEKDDVYLSQTSQLYLETCLSSFKKVFSIMPSYRAEKSKTRRHLAEYTHIEAELSYIKFDDLLDTLEDLIIYVCEDIMSKHYDLLEYSRKLHYERCPKPDDDEKSEIGYRYTPFVLPKRPFKRMTHEEAIEFCQRHDIKKLLLDKYGKPIFGDDGKEKKVHLKKGEDIPEGPEREMIDKIGEPVFLIKEDVDFC